MTGILVSTRPPTELGRLNGRYDEESDVLVLESKITRPWRYGVDVDGNLIFDLDQSFVLANVDLHIPKTRWKRTRIGIVATDSPPKDIVFALETVRTKSFSMPLQVQIDGERDLIRIEFGVGRSDSVVSLSKSCFALLSQSELIGFVVSRAFR